MKLLYLPVYSPDLNPIENMWSKLKAILCKLKIRWLPQLPHGIAQAFPLIRPSNCARWFSAAAIPFQQFPVVNLGDKVLLNRQFDSLQAERPVSTCSLAPWPHHLFLFTYSYYFDEGRVLAVLAVQQKHYSQILRSVFGRLSENVQYTYDLVDKYLRVWYILFK